MIFSKEREIIMSAIPQSVLIADTKNRVEDIVNHPSLPATVIELILKDAYVRASYKAQAEVQKEYEEYKAQRESESEVEA